MHVACYLNTRLMSELLTAETGLYLHFSRVIHALFCMDLISVMSVTSASGTYNIAKHHREDATFTV